jgi:hypothetical protein
MRNANFVLMALIFSLAGCGGGGGSSSSTTSGSSSSSGSTTADVQGEWQGSYSISGVSGSTAVDAVIKTGGYGFFFDANGVIYVLPALSGSTTLTGTLTAYAPLGYTFTNGSTEETFSLSGSVSSSDISGTFGGNNETGTFNLSRYTPYSGTPSITAGTWQGFYVGSGEAAVDLTVDANGNLSGNDGNGCTLTGTLSEVSGSNLFNVSVQSSGTSTQPGTVCAGTLSGLGYESSNDASGIFGGAAGTYFYAGVSNSSGAFIAEFKLP